MAYESHHPIKQSKDVTSDKHKFKLKQIFRFTVPDTETTIVFIIGLSVIFTRLWEGKPEQPKKLNKLIINQEMTIGRFGQANALPDSVLKKIFNLKEERYD